MNIDDNKNEKILNGDLVVLERKYEDDLEIVEYNREEFRDLVGYQTNLEIIADCITLLEGNQVYYEDGYYRLIKGMKMVINTFEIYSKYYIDSVNDNIRDEEGGL